MIEENKRWNKSFLFGIGFLVFVFYFFIFVNNSSAMEFIGGDGLLVYGDGTSVSSASYCTISGGVSSGLCGSVNNSLFGRFSSVSQSTINPLWVKVVASPNKNEALAGTLDGNGVFQLLKWNGARWGLEWSENNVGSASLDTKAFDLAYENNGDAVVAWAKTKGATGGTLTNDLEYRVWASGSWLASTSYNVTNNTASISWIEMDSHPASGSGQNDIGLIYVSAGATTKVGTVVWNGATNTWGNEPSKILEGDAEENGTVAGSSKTASLFYEQSSGKLVALWGVESTGNNTATQIIYTTWDGSNWTATAGYAPTAASDGASVLDCAGMPTIVSTDKKNNGVCTAYQGLAGATSIQDVWAFSWRAGAPVNEFVNCDTSAIANAAGTTGKTPVSTAWLIDGTSSASIGMYADATAASKDRCLQVTGAIWSVPATGMPATVAIAHDWFAVSNPADESKAVAFLVDANSDLFAYQASLSANTVTFNVLKGNVAITNDLATLNGIPVGFDYFRFASPSQTHYKWFNDDGDVGAGSAISAEDISASGSEALELGLTYRLRTEISNEGPGPANALNRAGNKYRLEMTKAAGTTCSTRANGWSWFTVPLVASIGSHAFDIEDSTSFTDGASTSSSILTASDPTFTSGYALDARATTGFQTLGGNNYSEFEWNLRPDSNNAVVGATYCFRVGMIINSSTTPDTMGSISYGAIASASVQPAVTFTQNDYEWFFNADNLTPGASIAGIENTIAQISDTTVKSRLRMNVTVGGTNMSANSKKFKLQSSVSTGGPWTDMAGANDPAWCNISDDCNSSWLNRRKITLNNSASAENLTNFPILISLRAASNSIDYSKTQNSGQDIRFVDASGTASLSYEINDWDESGTSKIWVKVPQIDSGSTTDYIWMYYNNTGAAAGQNASGVWSGNYGGVWHLDEIPNTANASSVGSIPCTPTAMEAGDQIAGQVSGSLDFDGAAEYSTCGDNLDFNFTDQRTITAWISPDTMPAVGARKQIVAKGQEGVTGWAFSMYEPDDGTPTTGALSIRYLGGAGETNAISTESILTTDSWTHVAAVYNNETITFYRNGAALGNTVVNTGATADGGNASPLCIACDNNAITALFDGQIDEFRFATTNRSVDWIEAEYNWSFKPWNYNTFASEETVSTTNSDGWSFYDNSSVANGATLPSSLVSTTEVLQTYNETSPTLNFNPNSATSGQDIEYDWSLDPASTTLTTTYYFRMIRSNGGVLDGYNSDGYPTLRIGISSGNNSGGGGGASQGGASGGGTPAGGGGSGGGSSINTGLKDPTATGEDYNQWSTATNAFSSNTTYAQEGTLNEKQDYYNFTLNVPAGATINGIEVKIEAFNSTDSGSCICIIGAEISWDGGSSYTTSGYDTGDLTLTDVVYSLGGATDTWGRTWSDTDLSNTNFRLRFNGDAFSGTSPAVLIDHTQVRIYYTTDVGGGSGGGAPQGGGAGGGGGGASPVIYDFFWWKRR